MDNTLARLQEFCAVLDRQFRPGQVHTRVFLKEIAPNQYQFYFLVRADGGYKDLSDRNRNFGFWVCEQEGVKGDGWEMAEVYAKQFELIMKNTYGWGDKELEEALLHGLPPNWRDGRMI